ncbi:MAG: hypothetical protein HY508_15325 [Acidobacteria bacterium]|nr:hypothetical protein [Acidobacteriota bacterium]
MRTLAPFDRVLAAGRGRARLWMVTKRALGSGRILALALSVLIAGGLKAQAEQKPPPGRLVAMRIFGSRRYSEAEIVRATELRLGAKAAPQAFQEAADRLAATGAFSDVNYTFSAKPGGVAVEFRVTDGGDFVACNFDNLVWFSEMELRAQLRQMIPLFAEEIPLKGDIPAKIEAAIAHLLKARGIPGTVTIMGAGEMGGALRALQFNVSGVRLVIQQVEFSGAQAVEPTALIAAIQPLLGADYDQTFVREFVRRNVTPLYARRGYLKVAFAAPRASVLAGSSQEVAVTIAIAEGDPYNLGEVHWEGNLVFPSGELAGHIHVLPAQPADTVQVEKDLEEIQTLYNTKGYLAAQLNFKPAFDDRARTVALDVQVREGDLYTMGKLEIAGVDPERAEALKKTSELLPGQPYSRAYWSTFISKSGRLLPASRTPWKASQKEDVHPDTKTVDVTLTFSPDTGK